MKLLVVSDLHLDLGLLYTAPKADFDAVVLAGDIQTPGVKGIKWAQRASTFGDRPVFYVPGNHEFYGTCMERELDAMRKAAAHTNVFLLERDAVTVDGVRFIGTTLWTDFQLPVLDDETLAWRPSDQEEANAAWIERMNDGQRITMPDAAARRGRRALTVADTVARHHESRTWLAAELLRSQPGCVVITHHGPKLRSQEAKYHSDPLSPAFSSELQSEFFQKPSHWIHGHLHHSIDYVEEGCRVICNPRGYRERDGSMENPSFNPGLIVTVDASL